MKKFIFILFLSVGLLKGQVKLDDFGRIVLNAYLPENIGLPGEAQKLLLNKLNQIVVNNGIGGSQVNPRFIITAVVNVGTKDIISGPPQMIAQNIDVTIFVGDAVKNSKFSSVILSLKGVGTNENKSFIEAIKTINPKNKEVVAFIEEGKKKIIDYYTTQCDFIIKEAQTLVKQEKFNEAIYELSLVPDVCQECYYKCLDTLAGVYQKSIDQDGLKKLNEAKIIWSASLNPDGAEKAGEVLNTINVNAACQKEAKKLIASIEAKLKSDEKEKWLFKMKQYEDKIAAQKEQVRIAEEKGKRDDVYRENQSKRDAIAQEKQANRNFELDKLRVNAYREIAVEQAKNQPKTVTYNNIIWR